MKAGLDFTILPLEHTWKTGGKTGKPCERNAKPVASDQERIRQLEEELRRLRGERLGANTGAAYEPTEVSGPGASSRTNPPNSRCARRRRGCRSVTAWPSSRSMPPRADDLQLRPSRISPPASLAAICAADDHDRAVHTYGRSFRDRIRAYNLQFPNPPDVVAHPTTEDEVTAVLDWCSSNGYAAIPYGGGSSTVAGFEPPEGYDGIVTIDLSALGPSAGSGRRFPLGADPGRGLRAGTGGATAPPRLHPAPLPAELRVFVAGRLDRHPLRRPLRHQPHPHRRLRGVGADGHADGRVGVAASARQRGRSQPRPHGHRQRGHPRHHHRGLDADTGPAPVPRLGGSDLPQLHGRVRRRPPRGAGQAVARQLPPAGPWRGPDRRWDGRQPRPAHHRLSSPAICLRTTTSARPSPSPATPGAPSRKRTSGFPRPATGTATPPAETPGGRGRSEPGATPSSALPTSATSPPAWGWWPRRWRRP